MKGLEEVLKRDKEWRKLAESICGSYDLAQDLVQDMYLKFINIEYINEALISISIKNLWLDTIKHKKVRNLTSIDSPLFDKELEFLVSDFEPEDYQQVYIDRFNELPMRQQEFILESFDFSVRQIADKFNSNRMYVQRQIHKGIKKVLQDKYDEYSNSNLKNLLIRNSK